MTCFCFSLKKKFPVIFFRSKTSSQPAIHLPNLSCFDTKSEWHKAGDCHIIMKTFVCILAFLALCISADQRNFNVEFEAFQENYNKIYANKTERFVRFLNFQHNLKEIEDFNSKNHSWKKSLNQFADLSKDELKGRLNGYINTHKPNRKVAAKKSINLKVRTYLFFEKLSN